MFRAAEQPSAFYCCCALCSRRQRRRRRACSDDQVHRRPSTNWQSSAQQRLTTTDDQPLGLSGSHLFTSRTRRLHVLPPTLAVLSSPPFMPSLRFSTPDFHPQSQSTPAARHAYAQRTACNPPSALIQSSRQGIDRVQLHIPTTLHPWRSTSPTSLHPTGLEDEGRMSRKRSALHFRVPLASADHRRGASPTLRFVLTSSTTFSIAPPSPSPARTRSREGRAFRSQRPPYS